MGVTVSLPLFGNPGRELEEGRPLKGRQLRDLAEDLHARLLRDADVLDKLEADGWTTQVAMFDVLLHHPAVQTQEQAVARCGPWRSTPTVDDRRGRRRGRGRRPMRTFVRTDAGRRTRTAPACRR